jgi:hypothetical protein
VGNNCKAEDSAYFHYNPNSYSNTHYSYTNSNHDLNNPSDRNTDTYPTPMTVQQIGLDANMRALSGISIVAIAIAEVFITKKKKS